MIEGRLFADQRRPRDAIRLFRNTQLGVIASVAPGSGLVNTPPRVTSLLIEFHRFGEAASSLQRDARYIRTTGWEAPAVEVAMPLDQRAFLKLLNRLRYRPNTSPQDVEKAVAELSAHAGVIFPALAGSASGSALQIDLVAGAAELWAFPFEALSAPDGPLFTQRDRPLVLTRRIRGAFADRNPEWPVRPRILFVHAPAASDLSQTLIDEHRQALEQALHPWARDSRLSEFLTTRKVYGSDDIIAARAEGDFTHVHVLAHGVTIPDPEVPQLLQWGLRLNSPGTPGVPPEQLAEALARREGLPVVVTIGACDSGNQAESGMPVRSFAQELHIRGIPVVVASQLPLTQRGSVVLTESFYKPLLRGGDVRLALHEARVRLHEERDTATGHDWLSMVAYVRLPEGYSDYLMELELRTQLAMLDAAQQHADMLAQEGGSEAQYDKAEADVQAVIDALTSRSGALDRHDPRQRHVSEECVGLIASGYKRLAELRFVRSRQGGVDAAAHKEQSRARLASALEHYRQAYSWNLHHHWSGIQQLALEAVLHGRFVNASQWTTVVRAAELDRDYAAAPGQPACDFWSCGSLAEAMLLAPIAGMSVGPQAAAEALGLFKARVPAGKTQPVNSTRRQLRRYVTWWTKENGFFPERPEDLSQAASELIKTL